MIAAFLFGAALSAPPHPLETALVQCGFPASAVSTRYEAELQSDVVVVRTSGAAPAEARLECAVAAALESDAFVRFTDRATAARFDERLGLEHRRRGQRAARLWLEERGLLATLPHYDPARQRTADHAAARERHCGFEPGTALRGEGDTLIFLPPDPESPFDAERFLCLLNAYSASAGAEHDLHFGFVSTPQPR